MPVFILAVIIEGLLNIVVRKKNALTKKKRPIVYVHHCCLHRPGIYLCRYLRAVAHTGESGRR